MSSLQRPCSSTQSYPLTPPRGPHHRHMDVERSLDLSHKKEIDPELWYEEVLRTSGMIETYSLRTFSVLSRLYADFSERLQIIFKSILIQNELGNELTFMMHRPPFYELAPSEILCLKEGSSTTSNSPVVRLDPMVLAHLKGKVALETSLPFSMNTPFVAHPEVLVKEEGPVPTFWKQGYVLVEKKEVTKAASKISNVLSKTFLEGVCAFKVASRKIVPLTYELYLNASKPCTLATITIWNDLFSNKEDDGREISLVSWGVTSRVFDLLIKVHSDNHGLRFLPVLAPSQVVICELSGKDSKESKMHLLSITNELFQRNLFEGFPINLVIDNSKTSLQDKMVKWRRRGIPIIVTFNYKDIISKTVDLFRRDELFETKAKVPVAGLQAYVMRDLAQIKQGYLTRAQSYK